MLQKQANHQFVQPSHRLDDLRPCKQALQRVQCRLLGFRGRGLGEGVPRLDDRGELAVHLHVPVIGDQVVHVGVLGVGVQFSEER